MNNHPKLKKIFPTLAALIISVLLIYYRDSVGHFRQYGYVGVLLVSFIGNATILMPAPVLMTVIAIGMSLNPFLVGISASIGAAMGESVGYFLGKAGNIVIEKSENFQKAKAYIDKYGYWAIAFLAAIPNPLFDLAGVMAGAAGITFAQFFLATWLGTWIKYTVMALVGAGIIKLS